jgi:predicted O-linked N-acetylglucosamine transferase (SPINDLY family)
MYDHTVGTFLSGWLENHTQKDFEIHTYYVGQKVDHVTRHISNLSPHFHYFAGNMEAAARQIDSDDLHLLVYSDIGMAPITLQLAALRLAPIQCKGWGHPVTTGLPTIDYYLSSDLMEPENAAAYYSESLVRLPNIALCYRPPKLPEKPKTRQALKIPDHRFVYLSTQSIFKYLPQHDDIYPRIAKAVPQACFVFISNESKSATTRFRLRLKKAFACYGLDAGQFCCFSKRVKFEDFLSLNMVADVLLDSLEWSGGKTTLEALSCGLPVVTLPGRFMRGRHAYAMLRMMGLDDTIADDKDAYCAIAVRLAKEPLFLSQIKAFIAQNRSKLYHDQSFIKALESFYRSVIFQYGIGNKHANANCP